VPGVDGSGNGSLAAAGSANLKQGATARDAIRQATLVPPGKQPGWLTAAVEEAERALGLVAAAAASALDGNGHGQTQTPPAYQPGSEAEYGAPHTEAESHGIGSAPTPDGDDGNGHYPGGTAG